jgi:hypothetical protein
MEVMSANQARQTIKEEISKQMHFFQTLVEGISGRIIKIEEEIECLKQGKRRYNK